MSNPFNDPITRSGASYQAIDFGLRNYMLKIYNAMALGLSITGLVSYVLSTQLALMQFLFTTPLLPYVIMFSPLILVFLISAKLQSYSVDRLRTLFITYAVLMGVSLSSIFLAFTGESIARVFFISSGMFLATSLYGYTTKRDLTGFGSFLFMGVIGLVIASIVNLFMQSSAVAFGLSVLTVLIFTGLTAYDTQMLKEIYSEHDHDDATARKVIYGALSLYINFINIFLAMLRLFGERR